MTYLTTSLALARYGGLREPNKLGNALRGTLFLENNGRATQRTNAQGRVIGKVFNECVV